MNFNVIRKEVVDSTNNYAVELIRRGELNNGDVILAREQDMGRGYGNNVWESEPGKNITMSICFKPENINASDQFILTKMLSLAVVDAISGLIKRDDVSVKWPNDIYIGDMKAAGILVQNYIAGSKIDTIIAGIGLNVNQQVFLSDAPNPVSLRNFTADDFDIEMVLSIILDKIDDYYCGAPDDDLQKKLDSKYLSKLYRHKISAKYEAEGIAFEGIITGVDEYGRLTITNSEGQHKLFAHKEVKFL